jgi:hypothetical protein
MEGNGGFKMPLGMVEKFPFHFSNHFDGFS